MEPIKAPFTEIYERYCLWLFPGGPPLVMRISGVQIGGIVKTSGVTRNIVKSVILLKLEGLV